MSQTNSVYESIGGHDTIQKLVHAFYSKVKNHPELQPIFPDDLTETARKQTQFLTQLFGGPPLYNEEHGHPRLRMRHLPFEITPIRRDAWLFCMKHALDEVNIMEPYRSFIFERLTKTAHHMVNTAENKKGESM
ncbi:group 2 truncated hemoglobin YjbI [Paraliobacillus ryukyuensis]|uniref:Hemoglobin n=1 Tax=Paraliobacillus ryukyuensis TaxID=200904 RepID=A0A366E728_9BACI|nr:globin [Paraliobacillus ryukyuensis]RBO98183.1 hemoglobin [Paraliobacillus ryukyuensis]